MDIGAVMDEVGDRIKTIEGLRVHRYPVGALAPPAAIVGMPEITFDATYGRGMDRWTLPVWVAVSASSERTARDVLGAYASGSGELSIKQVVESGTYTAFDNVRVVAAEFDPITIGATEYWAYRFDLDIAGQGA